MGQIRWGWVFKIVGIVLVLFVIAYLLFYLYISFYLYTAGSLKKEPEILPGTGITAEDLKRLKVPEPGEKVSENVAVPKEVVKAGSETKSKLRIFELKGENGQLLPNDFRVYQGDIVNIKLTAVDQDYDFRLEGYNLQMKANKGETKTIEFQALNLGFFKFYCSLCKTKEKAIGKVVVVPK